MLIKTSDSEVIKPFIKRLILPKSASHKGQNGKLLIIGGSSLFHAASIWSAAVASRIVDIVHYASTKENEQVFINLKSKFVDGIVVKQKELEHYVKEDDCVLAGPGMIRKVKSQKLKVKSPKYKEIIKIKDEGEYTHYLTNYLIENFPEKKFVFDAGALQMMDKEWLLKLKKKPILTPHQVEFQTLFGISIKNLSKKQKKKVIKEQAEKFNCLILVKAVSDIISDGKEVFEIQGGNAGLTKGGTGDVLAGLIAGLNTKNSQLVSAVISSFLLKKAADELLTESGFWYNASDLVYQIPKTMSKIVSNLSEN